MDRHVTCIDNGNKITASWTS